MQRCDPVEILRAIGHVLVVDHAPEARKDDFMQRFRKRLDARHERIESGMAGIAGKRRQDLLW